MQKTKRDMTALEDQVFRTLPVGYSLTNLPVKVKWLAKHFGASERDVYKAIETLIFLFGVPIVGLRQKPYGYFIATSEEEYNFFIASYKKQISTEQKRMACIKKNIKRFNKDIDKVNQN